MPKDKIERVAVVGVNLNIGAELKLWGLKLGGRFWSHDARAEVDGLKAAVSRRGWAARLLQLSLGPEGDLIVSVSEDSGVGRGGVTVTRAGRGDQPEMEIALAPGQDFPAGLVVAATIENGQPLCQIEAPGQAGNLEIRTGKGVGGNINIRQGRA